MSTTDCQYGFMALLFFRHIPTRLVFIPSTILAAYHAFHFLNGRFSNRALWKRYGEKAFTFMASRQVCITTIVCRRCDKCPFWQSDAALLNAVSEIGTGFVMLLQMFTPTRNVLITVMYWQWLRMRYWSPDSAAIHRQVSLHHTQRLSHSPLALFTGMGQYWTQSRSFAKDGSHSPHSDQSRTKMVHTTPCLIESIVL